MPIQDGQWLSKSDRGFALWAGLFSGPIAWAFQQQISYLLVPLACRTGHHFPLHLAAIVALLLIVGGGAITWHHWIGVEKKRSARAREAVARGRFMAALGLLLNGLSFVVILAQWIAVFMVGPCQT